MLAIPVLRSRVAPVFNWCSRIQIFLEGPPQEGEAQELVLPHLEAAQRLQVLQEKGVSTLICGALSADLLRYARQLGLTVVSGVAGEVREVVQSYWQKTLDHPKFWLPGCQGLRQYRSCRINGKALLDPDQARMSGRSVEGLGLGGFCQCPDCGARVPHEQGIPCAQMRCPRCSQIMERV